MKVLFFIITVAFFLDKYIDWKIALREWEKNIG
jgi:hypothetical protein